MGSYEEALITAARPKILAARARALALPEAVKGCLADLAPRPVALEPRFRPFPPETGASPDETPWVLEDAPGPADLTRFQVWVSPKQSFDWLRSELFLKQLQHLRRRVAWEVAGNRDRVTIALLCHRSDADAIAAAFRGQFEHCTLAPRDEGGRMLEGLPSEAWESLRFVDLFPPPPYSHGLTQPDELHVTPLESLVANLAQVPPPAVGFCQILFQPTAPAHDWHGNVEHFHDTAARCVRRLTREGLPIGQKLTGPESEAEALRLLERYEGDAGVGYEAALLDAREKGVGWVLSSLVEALKAEAREKQTRCVLDRYLDPTDWELLYAVTEILADRLRNYLPPDLAGLSTAQLAPSWRVLLMMCGDEP